MYPSDLDVCRRCVENQEHVLVKSLGLAVYLYIVRCFCQEFSTEEGVHCGKNASYKLSTIFSDYVRRDAIKRQRMIK